LAVEIAQAAKRHEFWPRLSKLLSSNGLLHAALLGSWIVFWTEQVLMAAVDRAAAELHLDDVRSAIC